MIRSLLIVLCAFGQTSARADGSAADLLLQSVGQAPQAAPASGSNGAGSVAPQINLAVPTALKLDDPFRLQLYAQWAASQAQGSGALPYEVNAWVLRVLQGQVAEPAHQWGSIRKAIPAHFARVADATWVYLNWKLDLPQSFFDAWLAQIAKPDFAQSPVAAALEQVIGSDFDAWLVSHAPSVSPEQRETLGRLGTSTNRTVVAAAAWAAVRDPARAAVLAPKLSTRSPLKIPLSRSWVLGLARKGDLGNAARVMKTHWEPAIQSLSDPSKSSAYSLELARLLYQAGAMDAAEQTYERIPPKAPEYLKAREELTWVLLRKGSQERLRGQLATLASPLFEKSFSPEVRLVRAISNLKLCFYGEVEKDLQAFIRQNQAWAGRIDEALASANPPESGAIDEYSQWAAQAASSRAEEARRLSKLAEESITAVLPAVGPQEHWVALQRRTQSLAELEQKHLSQERRRQWASNKVVLAEAIRKMQFVKVELQSQVRTLAQASDAPSDGADVIHVSHAAPVREPGQIVFPFDGVLWPDELFKLRSVAENRCLARSRGASSGTHP